jgi:hypothetical protein
LRFVMRERLRRTYPAGMGSCGCTASINPI